MKSDKYSDLFNSRYMMGPNCMMLLEEMDEHVPGAANGARVLDLGCGQGLSTLYIAREMGAAQIFATDLWISASELERNFTSWGIDDFAFPIHADAHALPFAGGFFDAVVSVDAYHYFGTEEGFFARSIWPLVKPGGRVMICVPGLAREEDGCTPLMHEWAGDEAALFHSAGWWHDRLTRGLCDVAQSSAYCSALSDRAWRDWFASGHEYAQRDREFLERGLGDILAFASVILTKE